MTKDETVELAAECSDNIFFFKEACNNSHKKGQKCGATSEGEGMRGSDLTTNLGNLL